MIRVLSGLSGLFTIGLALGAAASAVPIYLPVLAAMVTAVVFLSPRVPTVMRFLIGMFALSFLGLAAISASVSAGLIAPNPFLPPSSAAVVAAALVIVHYLISFVPAIRTVIDLAAPYFETSDRGVLDFGRLGRLRARESWIGLVFFGLVIALNVTQVYMSVLFSYNGNAMATALQDKDAASFWASVGYFSFVAIFWIGSQLIEIYITGLWQARWRRWMTDYYADHWLSNKIHYRLGLNAKLTDNPDQRIAEDVRDFIASTQGTYVQVFNMTLTLYAFTQILWNISAQFPYSIGGFDLSTIPGYLVWIALAVSVAATFGAHLIGKPLIGLNFRRQQVEADFRYNLVRVRENSEQIALLDGEPVERASLKQRFQAVFEITLALVSQRIKLVCFTGSFGQAMNIFPFVVLAPAYFTTAAMKYGVLAQTAQAFLSVQNALSFFVDFYATLAVYKSVIDRLTTFDHAIAEAEKTRSQGIAVVAGKDDAVSAADLDVVLPNGKPLLDDVAVTFRQGERTLLTGPSGSGKTTLFRALAGIWPFGRGTVKVPKDEDVMLMPQQPYLPLGTLRSVLTYPAPAEAFPDEAIRAALARVDLAALGDRLDAVEPWANALSGGEKQRVSMVRALLRKPKWLFLDEATSALGEAAEKDLYAVLRAELPETTIVSIGHRSSLAALHDRRVAIETDGGKARLVDAPLASFAAGG